MPRRRADVEELWLGLSACGSARRVFAPAGRLTFFAGAKKVNKETPPYPFCLLTGEVGAFVVRSLGSTRLARFGLKQLG